MPECFEIYIVYKMALYKYSSFPFSLILQAVVIAHMLSTGGEVNLSVCQMQSFLCITNYCDYWFSSSACSGTEPLRISGSGVSFLAIVLPVT